MKSYEVELSNDDLLIIITGDEKSSTIIIPINDHEALAEAIEELLRHAYLDGKVEGRSASQP